MGQCVGPWRQEEGGPAVRKALFLRADLVSELEEGDSGRSLPYWGHYFPSFPAPLFT